MSLERQSRSSLLNSTLVTDVTLLILLLVDMVEFSSMSICHSFDLGRSTFNCLDALRENPPNFLTSSHFLTSYVGGTLAESPKSTNVQRPLDIWAHLPITMSFSFRDGHRVRPSPLGNFDFLATYYTERVARRSIREEDLVSHEYRERAFVRDD